MYKLNQKNGVTVSISNLETGISFLLDPDNTDYQAYLKWVAEGNTPEPADEAQ